MRRSIGLALALAACTPPHRVPWREPEAPVTARPRDGTWQLTWHGAPIGAAWERERAGRFERRERILVRRGDALVRSDLSIVVTRDAHGAPGEITVERWGDGPALTGRARATASGWSIEVDGESPTHVSPATPFELALRDAGRHGGFHGPVLLAGWGFAIADLDLAPAPAPAPASEPWIARLTVGGRSAIAQVRYDDEGRVLEVDSGDGVAAHLAAPTSPLRPATPIEVVGGSALAVEGAAPDAAIHGVRFPDATAAPPADLPGQTATRDRSGWNVRFSDDDGTPPAVATPPANAVPPAIAALVHEVAATVDDDLGATATTIGAARTATRGDCTTHALRFAALAEDAGIPVRIVTGVRLDGGMLVRHRWDLAWTGTRWIAVDPTWDQAPARDVIGLAAHGARAADLAAADATAFDGLGARAIALP